MSSGAFIFSVIRSVLNLLIVMNNYVKKSPPIIFLLMIFIFATGFSIQCLYAQEGYIIREIKFIGNHSFSSKELSNYMILRGTSKFKQIFLRKKPVLFDETTLKSDLNRIQKFYQSEGFLDTKVTYRLETNQHPHSDFRRRADSCSTNHLSI